MFVVIPAKAGIQCLFRERQFSRLAAAFALALFLSSCASAGPKVKPEAIKKNQEEFNAKYFEAAKDYEPRIFRVGYRLISHHVPGHGSAKPKINFVGVGVDSIEDYSRTVYGIDKKTKGILVIGLYPGSQAESLDLVPGDVIQKLDRKKIKKLKPYFKKIRTTKKETLKAQVWRKGKIIERELPVEKVYYKAVFYLAPSPNLYARSIFSEVDTGIGILRYCPSDDELAMIMGHELAHTTLRHSSKYLLAGIATLGIAWVVDDFTCFISRREENQADYFGIKHAFFGGYDAQSGIQVFKKLAIDSPGFEDAGFLPDEHPPNPERFLRAEKTVDELKARYPERFKP